MVVKLPSYVERDIAAQAAREQAAREQENAATPSPLLIQFRKKAWLYALVFVAGFAIGAGTMAWVNADPYTYHTVGEGLYQTLVRTSRRTGATEKLDPFGSYSRWVKVDPSNKQ